ncbi:MAG: helix-turn-helix domain-containing protein [Ruminococcus sp.]|nr:helix-turn-helix domain-containing protein [Ruminococcus sp.]
MNLGERLFELRKTEGLSQEEVAERLSVTRQTVSKWETGQSTPDFDKVLPLCELYHISTEELFTGEKSDHSEISVSEALNDNEESPEEIALKKQQFREKSARVVSIAVFIYIASVVVLMIGIPVLQINPIVMSGIFLLMIGFATAMIIRHYMSKPKFPDTPREKKEKSLKTRVKNIIGICVLIIYLLVSFLTAAWHITWILWVVYILIREIVNVIFMLKEGKQNEE